MGCASSTDAPLAKTNMPKNKKYQRSPSIDNRSNAKNSKSSSPNPKSGQSKGSQSPKKDYLRSSSQRSLKKSTAPFEKTPQKAYEGASSDKNIRNSNQGLSISESKIKLEVKEIIDENEEEKEDTRRSYKKLRKTKKKRLVGDPRMGEMAKIYAWLFNFQCFNST